MNHEELEFEEALGRRRQAMSDDNERTFEDILKFRRQSISESLRTISIAELRELTDELFPYSDHPWLAKLMEVIKDPASGPLHHAMADDRVHVLYCPVKNIGMWFIPETGKGPLQPPELDVMRDAVQGRS